MTTVAVLVEPPQSGDALTEFVGDDALTADEAAALYAAMTRDVCAAVEASGGELLVNYRPSESPDDAGTDDEALREVREVVSAGVADPDSVRYERQVGSTLSARVGNTVTHLLDREGVQSAAAVEPGAALLERRYVDSAAMKLRQSDVVLGPATDGRLWYASFREPIDFADAFEPPAIETVTERARSEGLSVDYLETLPTVERPGDLATVVSLLRARRRAEKRVPAYTTAVIEDLGLRTETVDGELRVARD